MEEGHPHRKAMGVPFVLFHNANISCKGGHIGETQLPIRKTPEGIGTKEKERGKAASQTGSKNYQAR
jgi:hypothetical protein